MNNERRIAEEALRESEQHWRSLIEALPQLVWSATPDGACDYFSTQWTEYTGVAESELLGWRWMDVLHPDDRQNTRQIWTDSVAGRRAYDVEYRVRRHDGTYGWFKTRGVPIRDSNGNIVKWFGSCTDITDRKRAEEALRESEQELRKARNELEKKVAERTAELRRSEAYLAEAQRLTRTGSFGWEVFSGKLYWSEETFRIFERDPAHQPTVDFVLQRAHPQDRAVVQQTIDRARQYRTARDFEQRLLMPDGQIKHAHIVGHPAFDEAGNLAEIVGTVMDVTERHRADQERQAIAHINRVTTMGQLTASIAHEVMQPVAAVVISAQAALRWIDINPPNLQEVRQALTSIVGDGTRVGEVIGRIRALIAKAPPRKDRLDINNMILEVIALTRGEIHRNGVALRTRLAPDLPLVGGDRVQLQQVMLNLILNAVEALRGVSEGSRDLLISSEDGGADGVRVAVQDSGPGLTPESVDRLFEAFYTTKSTGLGMGLAICRSIIEAHEGRLWATANEPLGAVLQFRLPPERDETAPAKRAGQN